MAVLPAQALFRELDTDKNGSVSMDELSAGLRQQGYVLADHELEQLVRFACLHGLEGGSSVLSAHGPRLVLRDQSHAFG